MDTGVEGDQYTHNSQLLLKTCNKTKCSIKRYKRLFNVVTNWWMFRIQHVSNRIQESTGNYLNIGVVENKMLEILAYAAYFSPFHLPVKEKEKP